VVKSSFFWNISVVAELILGRVNWWNL